jgi:hypothetical protein
LILMRCLLVGMASQVSVGLTCTLTSHYPQGPPGFFWQLNPGYFLLPYSFV